MNTSSCDHCRFWIRATISDADHDESLIGDDGAIMIGECHRYPPQRLNHDLISYYDRWLDCRYPVTVDCDSCGEFSLRGDASARRCKHCGLHDSNLELHEGEWQHPACWEASLAARWTNSLPAAHPIEICTFRDPGVGVYKIVPGPPIDPK